METENYHKQLVTDFVTFSALAATDLACVLQTWAIRERQVMLNVRKIFTRVFENDRDEISCYMKNMKRKLLNLEETLRHSKIATLFQDAMIDNWWRDFLLHGFTLNSSLDMDATDMEFLLESLKDEFEVRFRKKVHSNLKTISNFTTNNYLYNFSVTVFRPKTFRRNLD